MSNKVRLISTISAICMVLALLTVGVWAVSNASVTLGGTISFSATNVHAEVAGNINIAGADENPTIDTLSFDVDTDVNSQTFKDKLATWTNPLTFTTENEIEMTITVTNKSTERDLYVTVTDNTNVTNLKKTLDFTSAQEVKIDKGGTNSETFTITFNVESMNKSVNGNYGFQIDLRDESAEAPAQPEAPVLMTNIRTDEDTTWGDYNGMEFECSGDFATIVDVDQSVTNVIIPERVTDGVNVYKVDTIYETFWGLGNLETVEVPESINHFSYAFRECSKLKSVTLHSKKPATDYDESFIDNHKDFKIYVPDESVDAYKTSWSEFADIIKPLSQKP